MSSGTAVSASGTFVQRVPQQRDRPRQQHHRGLDSSGHSQDQQAQQKCPAAIRVGLQGLVDLIGAVMGMSTEDLRDAMTGPQPDR
jgi:hypothetical protein